MLLAEDVIHGTKVAEKFAAFKKPRKLTNIYSSTINLCRKVIFGNG
jgi:hypothetical protein